LYIHNLEVVIVTHNVTTATAVPDVSVPPESAQSTITQPAESIYKRPTRQQAIDAIIADPAVARAYPRQRITKELATGIFHYIEGFVNNCRASVHGLYYPTTTELRSKYYAGFDAMFEHNDRPAPAGSTGSIVAEALFKDGEVGLRHDMDPRNGIDHCAVWVVTDSVG
jgi:hypothetical protein